MAYQLHRSPSPAGRPFFSGPSLVWVFSLLFTLSFSACLPSPSSTHPPSTPTLRPSISPSPLPSLTASLPSPSPTPTSSPTPLVPTCASSDYCIVDGSFLFQLPIQPPGWMIVDRTYPYGSTQEGARDPHHGVEFPNLRGTPVVAVAPGLVYYAGDDLSRQFGPASNFYGSLVILEHDFLGQKLYTLYAHLAGVLVSTGQSVTTGEMLGMVGSSGSAIGSHLHFEVRLDPQEYDSTLNPELWLIPAPDRGVLSIRFVDAAGNFARLQPDIQYYPDPNATFVNAWQPEVYAPGMPLSPENCVLGNLEPGRYRIAYLWEGGLYERWIEIQPGKLILVTIEVP